MWVSPFSDVSLPLGSGAPLSSAPGTLHVRLPRGGKSQPIRRRLRPHKSLHRPAWPGFAADEWSLFRRGVTSPRPPRTARCPWARAARAADPQCCGSYGRRRRRRTEMGRGRPRASRPDAPTWLCFKSCRHDRFPCVRNHEDTPSSIFGEGARAGRDSRRSCRGNGRRAPCSQYRPLGVGSRTRARRRASPPGTRSR